MANGTNPLMLLDELRDLGPCRIVALTDRLPTLEELTPTHCHIGWDVTVETDEPASAVEDVFIFVMDDMELAITRSRSTRPKPRRTPPPRPRCGSGHSARSACGRHPRRPAAAGPARRRQGRRTCPRPRRTAGRADGPGRRTGDRAEPPVADRASGWRPRPPLRLRGDRAAGRRVARHDDGAAHDARRQPVRPLPPLVHDLARDTGKAIDLVTTARRPRSTRR